MYKILRKKRLNPTVTLMEIDAPKAARHAEPGQFIILRVDDEGERIPLTIADFDREKGSVTIIYQIVGATTRKLDMKNEGEYIADFVGPLGRATETEGKKKVCVVGGGLGCAIAYPVAKKLHEELQKQIDIRHAERVRMAMSDKQLYKELNKSYGKK